MGWRRMHEIKTRIRTNTNNQDSLSKFRDTIISKIVQLRNYNISRLDILEIFNNLLDSFFTISR